LKQKDTRVFRGRNRTFNCPERKIADVSVV
jgi:hypothetical protein